jgi:hypothetical protein
MLDINSIDSSDSLLNQVLHIKKKYTNPELLLHHYFYQCCKVYPKNIILINNFVFFFVSSRDYFNAKISLPLMRRQIQNKKILIIRVERTFLRLLYNFFPDPYVHDIRVYRNVYSGKKDIIVGFLSFVERGIAIGCKGEYIKAVNKLFENYILFDNDDGFPINIKCEVVRI